MTDRRLTDAHMRASFDRSERVGRYVARLGRSLGVDSEDFVDSAVDVVLAGQAEQALATWAYLETTSELADPLGRVLGVDPPVDKLIGSATHNGTPLETVYRRPAGLADELSEAGSSSAEIAARIDSELEATAAADVATAGRNTEQAYGAVDKRVVGWRRVPDANACDWCQYIATMRYKTEDLAPAHKNCHCGTEPIVGTVDPGPVVDREALAEIKKNGVPKRYGQRRRDARRANRRVQQGPKLEPITESPATRGLPKKAKLAADSPEVVAVAERYGLTPDEVFAARGRAKDVKQMMRDEAARLHAEHAETLYRWNGEKIRGPGAIKGDLPPEYDWFKGLDQREKARLSRNWFDKHSSPPDVFGQALSSVDETLAGLDYEDVIEEWLRVNREYEAAGAIRRGKLPSSRAYSGEIDVDKLLPQMADDGYSVEKILASSDDLDVAGHIASVEKELVVDEARNYLGAAFDTQHGAPPYRMSYQSWHDEIRDLEYGLREFPGEMPANAKARLLELAPEYIDEPGLDFEDLYARIVDTAAKAGEEIPDHAHIPWK